MKIFFPIRSLAYLNFLSHRCAGVRSRKKLLSRKAPRECVGLFSRRS